MRNSYFFVMAITLCNLVSSFASAESILIQSTTSTQNSGLYEVLLPSFTQATGIEAKIVAVGTGQAIKNAQNCDGDVLLVHSTQDEEAFVTAGYGVNRFDLMYNDFVIIGPTADPLQLGHAQTLDNALTVLLQGKARFISRGDDSGTHKAEQRLWNRIGAELSSQQPWYLETGSSMGTTLNIAVELQAYTLTDRATWLAFRNRRKHRILFEGNPSLFNQYGVILVHPEHCQNVKAEAGQAFINWVLSREGQATINSYQRDGQQLFFANASKNHTESE